MKSQRFFAWMYKYFIKVQKYREDGYLIVYLEEIQFVSHDTVRMVWPGGTKSCLCQDHCREEKEQYNVMLGAVKDLQKTPFYFAEKHF